MSHCPEIKEVNKLKECIQQRAMVLREFKNNPKGFDPRIINERRTLYQELSRLVELLESPKNKTTVMYTYSSEQDFFKGQVALLNVANKLFYFLEEDETVICELCWRGLIAIMGRGEFLLSYIGFTAEATLPGKKKTQTAL